eukprot:jgi/Ulvmu1/7087/UM033_0148.1
MGAAITADVTGTEASGVADAETGSDGAQGSAGAWLRGAGADERSSEAGSGVRSLVEAGWVTHSEGSGGAADSGTVWASASECNSGRTVEVSNPEAAGGGVVSAEAAGGGCRVSVATAARDPSNDAVNDSSGGSSAMHSLENAGWELGATGGGSAAPAGTGSMPASASGSSEAGAAVAHESRAQHSAPQFGLAAVSAEDEGGQQSAAAEAVAPGSLGEGGMHAVVVDVPSAQHGERVG